ncbi:MAG: magnesium chelatase [Parcubacteria group bacterium CG08_land_8_20_14_0_20_43_9]|nr:MAG: magnesium chelatase [Parcubacteria group bacterium CG08_land_8_20_14_0_20_43_9]
MSCKIFSGAVIGLDTQIIEVESDISYGLRSFDIVGLGDKAVEESKERIKSAIKSCGLRPPFSKPEKIIINLAPADLKKEGSLYDLPIALAYLVKSKQIDANCQGRAFAGELSLDGTLRPIKGGLSFALKASEAGFLELILPVENVKEAVLSQIDTRGNDLKIIGVDSLQTAINYLEGKIIIEPAVLDMSKLIEDEGYEIGLDWVRGQEHAKRALIIAAAGGHNLALIGPPGGGKSLLAKSLPSILPNLSPGEMLELTKIYSIAGLLSKEKPIITKRPFRSAHHTASKVSIIGGGNPVRPGEITLAHRGVLFLDEFPEFNRDVIEALRQPLEDGHITIMRANQRIAFPSHFSLIAAANPCPCGHLNDPNHPCSCTPSQIAKYRRKLSGPIIDRIDMTVELPQVEFEKLTAPGDNQETIEAKKEIEGARQKQYERFKDNKILTNSEMEIPEIKKYCQIDSSASNIMRNYVDSGKLSARGYHRVLKIARTIADLAETEEIALENLHEALMYRLPDLPDNQ